MLTLCWLFHGLLLCDTAPTYSDHSMKSFAESIPSHLLNLGKASWTTLWQMYEKILLSLFFRFHRLYRETQVRGESVLVVVYKISICFQGVWNCWCRLIYTQFFSKPHAWHAYFTMPTPFLRLWYLQRDEIIFHRFYLLR